MILADSEIMTAEQAAIFSGCSNTWIRKLLREGRVDGYRTFTAAGKRTGPWLVTRGVATRIRAELSTRARCNAGKRRSARANKRRRA